MKPYVVEFVVRCRQEGGIIDARRVRRCFIVPAIGDEVWFEAFDFEGRVSERTLLFNDNTLHPNIVARVFVEARYQDYVDALLRNEPECEESPDWLDPRWQQ